MSEFERFIPLLHCGIEGSMLALEINLPGLPHQTDRDDDWVIVSDRLVSLGVS